MREFPLREVRPLLQGYKDSLGSSVSQCKVDAGAPRQRKKYTAVMDQLSVGYVLTTEQKNILRQFLDETAGCSFWMPDPERDGKEIYVRLIPKGEQAVDFIPRGNGLWQCELTLGVWRYAKRN